VDIGTTSAALLEEMAPPTKAADEVEVMIDEVVLGCWSCIVAVEFLGLLS
jgi:hypothetical protein